MTFDSLFMVFFSRFASAFYSSLLLRFKLIDSTFLFLLFDSSMRLQSFHAETPTPTLKRPARRVKSSPKPTEQSKPSELEVEPQPLTANPESENHALFHDVSWPFANLMLPWPMDE